MDRILKITFTLLGPILPLVSQASTQTSSVLSTGKLGQVALMLLLIIACIFIFGFLLKRTQWAGKRTGGVIKALATLPLGTKEKILLVEVGEQQLLIGMTASQIQTLHVLNEKVTVSSKESPVDFATQLKAVLRKGQTK